MFINKQFVFSCYLLTLLIISSSMEASDPTNWEVLRGHVGSESYEVKMPVGSKLTYQDEQMQITARDGKEASYLLKVFNPPKAYPDSGKAFAIFRAVISQPPKSILDYKVSVQGGNAVMDVVTVNNQTAVKSRYHYVITSKNVWQIKSIYTNDDLHHHPKFLSSFQINDN